MRVTESSPLCALLLSRTDALLVKLSLLVGQQVFYGALWGSMLVTPMVRLPASVFIVTHFDRMASLSQQVYMLGYDQRLVVSASAHEILTYGNNSCHFSSLFVFYNSCYRMSELLSVYRWSHFVYLCKIQMPWCRGTHLKSCSTFSHLQHAW